MKMHVKDAVPVRKCVLRSSKWEMTGRHMLSDPTNATPAIARKQQILVLCSA
jgi:hypothetical protein